MKSLRKWMMLAAACVIAPAFAVGAASAETRVVFVTHGQAADQYWSVVKHGMDDAAKTMGVKAEYLAPETFDMPAMQKLLDAAIASKPDGLVVSIPDEGALGSLGRERGEVRHPGDRDRFRRIGTVAQAGRAAVHGPVGVRRRRRGRPEGARRSASPRRSASITRSAMSASMIAAAASPTGSAPKCRCCRA